MKPNQKIPSGNGTAEHIEKKSRFISNLFYVTSVEEANGKLEQLRKQYWDASHNCYAYVLDSDNVMRFSDDGEPQGTAGMPILEVLKKQQIYCALIVVTRYFGGTLLGAGGLVRAYGKAATMAIEAAGVSRLTPYYTLEVDCGYNFLTPLRNCYEQFEVAEKNADYGVNVLLSLEIPTERYEAFHKYVTELTSALVVPGIAEEILLPKKI